MRARLARAPQRWEDLPGGVEAEVENAALYERLMRSTEREDILAVFENLRRAS